MNRTARDIDKRHSQRWHGDIVVEWLNGKIPVGFGDETILIEITGENLRRIRQVFELILTVVEFPRAHPEAWDMEKVDELNRILRRYPKIFEFGMGSLGFCESRRVPNSERIDAYEAGAVESMLDLGREGLKKLRICACGSWYFEKKSDHISCTPACRKKKHEQTPEYKAKRAEQMRTVRAVHARNDPKTRRSRPRPLRAIGKVSK